MLQVREKAEGHIIRQINSGRLVKASLLIWFLKRLQAQLSVKEFILDGKWNLAKFNLFLLDNIISHISDIEIGNLDREDQVF